MKPYITVTSGMSGYYAVLVDDQGPIETGIGRYDTTSEAELEAIEWATAACVRYVAPSTK